MRRYLWLVSSVLYAQHALTMGARLQVTRASLLSPTDRTSPLTTPAPTYKAGIVGFFGWGWTPHFATSMEIAYQGAGQRFYGVGMRGESYTAEVSLHYLRLAAAFQPQYARETWGVWASLAPGVSILTQSELTYRGDSLVPGSTATPQIVRRVLTYLDQSTNPDDRLLLTQMYRRAVPAVSVAGGLRIRLAPGVWALGLLSYERSFADLEKKSFRLRGEETPLYGSERKPVQYQLSGIQLGLQYEVGIHP